MRRNQSHKELTDFRKKLRSMPDDVDALSELASVYMESGRSADAVVVLQQLLAKRPRDTQAMIDCGT
ncbi:MAG TPA: tetratricopeptide repeat protein, partial [bacterium]|nr:tetratricopeptide repeat protein [bacterium]